MTKQKKSHNIPDMSYELEIQTTVTHLSSPLALAQMETNHYWPKWDGPWWQMLLLHEIGETKRIPKIMIERFVKTLNELPIKTFPFTAEEIPAHLDPYLDTACHCQLGNVYQVLSASGVDVDKEVPWIRPWLLKYQMEDGGLTCDNEAYLVKDECPSSMVGTISAFETILLCTNREWTEQERLFLDKGASFLITRKLMLGSPTKFNSSERESAKDWVKLCFPRFYFYDVLRGLNALSLWSEKTKQALPKDAIAEVVKIISEKSPDQGLKVERHAFEGTTSINQNSNGEWIGRQPAGHFPLFERVSQIGEVSPYLTKQWVSFRSRHQ